MRLPQSLDVKGAFRVRFSAELNGEPLDLNLTSGRMAFKAGGEKWLEAIIEGDQLTLNLNPVLARKMMGLAGHVVGWWWMAKKSPAFLRAMQQFSDQSGATVTLLLGGKRLASFAPHARPSFNPLGLRGFWG